MSEWYSVFFFAVKHQTFDLLRILGLRDRLRCPDCSAVGTYKPHGGWLDSKDTRGRRRWLCKWCGYYKGPVEALGANVNGRLCYPSRSKKCWSFWEDKDSYRDTDRRTPQYIIFDYIPGVDPWRG